MLRPADSTGAGTGFHRLDETKLLVGTRDLAVDARAIVARLNQVHGVQPELQRCRTRAVLSAPSATPTADMDRLVEGFTESGRLGRTMRPRAGRRLTTRPSIADLLAHRAGGRADPEEAFFADTETVPPAHATDRVAAEAITPSPAGCPLGDAGRTADRRRHRAAAAPQGGNPISASDSEPRRRHRRAVPGLAVHPALGVGVALHRGVHGCLVQLAVGQCLLEPVQDGGHSRRW